jgi:hypothetical protein
MYIPTSKPEVPEVIMTIMNEEIKNMKMGPFRIPA